MARDDFFQSVRTAIRFVAPTVDADNPYTDAKALEQVLRGSASWLTPKSVEGYRARDFKDLSPEQQSALASAVEAFLSVAKEVTPRAPATAAQVRNALPPFLQVVTSVQDIIRKEWVEAVEGLLRDAEKWSASRDWPTKRIERQLVEDFLGTYTMSRLLIAQDGNRLVLEPVARFVPGATGLVDFAVLPSYDSVRITRTEGRWRVHPVREGKPRQWSEDVFVDTAIQLGKLT